METVHVVHGLRNILLGLPAISSLHLANRIESFAEVPDVQSEFADLFHGLGTLGDEYAIKLSDRAQPFALHAPRRVPLPL